MISTIASGENTHLKFSVERDITLCLEQNFTAKAQENPVVILIGGFQGSGKSTLIANITRIFDANVISADVIRQQLIDRGYDVTICPEFSKHIHPICTSLFKTALANKTHIIIDANAHSRRLQTIEELLKESAGSHTLVKVLLTASDETLRERIRTRVPTPGCYHGTECDLDGSLRTVEIQPENYDLIIDTEASTPDETANQLQKMLDII